MELENMINEIVEAARLRGSNLMSRVIFEILQKYGIDEKDALYYLSDERLDTIDRLFDYEKDDFECLTQTSNIKTRFAITSPNKPNVHYRGRIVIPIKNESIEIVIDKVLRFLVDSKIHVEGTVSNRLRNDSMIVGLSTQEDISKVFRFLQSNEIKPHLNELTPLIPNYNGVGFINYTSDTDYLEKLADNLTIFLHTLAKNKILDRFSLEYFSESLTEAVNSGRTLNTVILRDISESMKTVNEKNMTRKK